MMLCHWVTSSWHFEDTALIQSHVQEGFTVKTYDFRRNVISLQTASVLLSWKVVRLHFSTVRYINLKSTFLK